MYEYNDRNLIGAAPTITITPADTGKTFMVGASATVEIPPGAFDEHSRIRFVKQDKTIVTIDVINYSIDGWLAPEDMENYNGYNLNPSINSLKMTEYPQFIELMYSSDVGEAGGDGIWIVVDKSYTIPKKEILPFIEYATMSDYSLSGDDLGTSSNTGFEVMQPLHFSGFADGIELTSDELTNHPAGQITFETTSMGVGYPDQYSNFAYQPRDDGLYLVQFNIAIAAFYDINPIANAKLFVSINDNSSYVTFDRTQQFVATKMIGGSNQYNRSITFTSFFSDQGLYIIKFGTLETATSGQFKVLAGSSLRIVKLSDWIAQQQG